jgi:hypothetical protein
LHGSGETTNVFLKSKSASKDMATRWIVRFGKSHLVAMILIKNGSKKGGKKLPVMKFFRSIKIFSTKEISLKDNFMRNVTNMPEA